MLNLMALRHTPDGPSIHDSLTIAAVHCDTYDGFSVSITNKQSESQWVTHNPSRLFNLPIFMHVPFMPEITFLPKPKDDKHFQLKFPLVIRTEGNPRFLTDGLTYVTQLGEFRATFPGYEGLQP